MIDLAEYKYEFTYGRSLDVYSKGNHWLVIDSETHSNKIKGLSNRLVVEWDKE